jgi:hypothetical protein
MQKTTQGPPDRPKTFDECLTFAMRSIDELENQHKIIGDDQKAVTNLREVATLANTLLLAFKESGGPNWFMGNFKNIYNIKKITDCLKAFDGETWVPKVASDVQAQVADIYSEFIRNCRGIIREDQNPKKPEKEKLFSKDKMLWLKDKNVEGALFKMAEAASDNRRAYNANKSQANNTSVEQEGKSHPRPQWTNPQKPEQPSSDNRSDFTLKK